jgi:hypothetical protein
MFCISIQIRPKVAASFTREELLDRVHHIRSPEVDAYEEKGKLLLSFNFFTELPNSLWNQLQAALFDHSEFGLQLKNNCIVLAEDEITEACYLLHHFDTNEALDRLPEKV